MKNLKIIMISTLLFTGCSTTGLKNYNDFALNVNQSSNDNIVIYRSSGFVGGGTVFTVMLNGLELGKIGTKEFLLGKMQEGKNYIEVKVDGIQGVGLNKPQKMLEKNNKNEYFKVGDTGLDANIYIEEISFEEFKSLSQN